MTTKESVTNFLNAIEFFQYNFKHFVKQKNNDLVFIEFSDFDEDLNDVVETMSEQCGLKCIETYWDKNDAWMFNLPGQGSFGFCIDKEAGDVFFIMLNNKFFTHQRKW